MDQGVGRSVEGGVKARMVCQVATFRRVGSEFLMRLLGCEGVFSLQLR